ncbi:citrate/2-methylcitrate synthase [Aestuariivirga litoralis]|uniref:citrate/2-methylcitrate synthase n=1 Tax=Aestuariivirga litoralis TaxID=2650924 RepID=UPI0018C853F9|nr:citrate/2-methylcitrate synthase [Aestuariivirga litoralis]MBG1231215.1 citrate (Si)-synthase [Aestuariivirga litoralis]
MAEEEKIEIRRGLKGVYFERSATSDIDGKAGTLTYRGYSIHDLAEKSTFEEVAYLLIHGELPKAAELAAFDKALKAARDLPEQISGLISTLKSAHPMDVLRTAVSALAAFDPQRDDFSVVAMRAKGTRLTAQIPVIIAAHHAARSAKSLPKPDHALSQAANFLWMITGHKPSAETAALMDRDMILHAEHGANASTFAARVVIGTEADLHAAMTAAIAALSGAAHGGAAEDVMKMAQEIGTPENAAAYVKAKRAAGEAVTGFGHRVYRTEDPRARHLRDGVEKLSAAMGQPKWYEILQAVTEAMKPYARFGVNVNVDFYAGVIYYLHGIPQEMFVPIFAAGRAPGWVAQCIEQAQNNILIRPLTLYDGPAPRDYQPIVSR